MYSVLSQAVFGAVSCVFGAVSCVFGAVSCVFAHVQAAHMYLTGGLDALQVQREIDKV